MDRQAMEEAFRVFFASREQPCVILVSRLSAAAVGDGRLRFGMRLESYRSAQIFRLDLLHMIRLHHFDLRGRERESAERLLDSLRAVSVPPELAP